MLPGAAASLDRYQRLSVALEERCMGVARVIVSFRRRIGPGRKGTTSLQGSVAGGSVRCAIVVELRNGTGLS